MDLGTRVAYRHLEGAIEKGTFYHGTAFENLDSILEEGLQTSAGGSGWGPVGIYQTDVNSLFLTGEFGRAARYARKYDIPVVLKIRISKPGRINKLRTDPADDPMMEGRRRAPTHVSPEKDPLYDLKQDLDDYFDSRGINYIRGLLPEFDGPSGDYETKVKRTNLYKEVKQVLQGYFPEDPNRADNEYDNFLRAFRPGQYGLVHIRNDGSLKLDSHYYEQQHQVMYPDDVPPAAVKEVWVPETHWEVLGVEPTNTRTVRVKTLEGEAQQIWEDILWFARERLPEALRDNGEEAAIDATERFLEDTLDTKGERREAEFLNDYVDRYIDDPEMTTEEAADKIEQEAGYLPDYVDNPRGFGTYNLEFGEVRPGSL